MNLIHRTFSYSRTSSIILFSVVFTFFAGCGSTSKVPANSTPVTQIMVLPVAPIKKLFTENKGVPMGMLWQGLADRHKSAAFTESMETTRNSMALALTSELLKELKAQGFEAQVLEGVARPPASPDDIDYPKLPTTQPVLHVYFEEVGMYSSRFSLDYIPRVNVTAYLVRPQSAESIYNETIYYGADARGESHKSIPADARYKWPSFDALIQQPKEVSDAYGAAVTAIASKIALNLRATAPASRIAASNASVGFQ